MKEIDPTESYTLMYFDMPAWGLQMSEKLAADHGRKVEYPISGDALARIRAKA